MVFSGKKDPEVRLMVRFGENEWSLDLREIGFDGIDPTTLNQDALMNQIRETIEKEVNRKPQPQDTSKDRKVVPHQLGVKVDRQKIKLWFDEIHDYINRPVDLPVQWSMPELTTKELLQLKEKVLGSYTTFFNYRNVNRSHNIYLSAKAIDHHVLMPGETFSFNKVVGIRSRARGYRMAKIIVKGGNTAKGWAAAFAKLHPLCLMPLIWRGLKLLNETATAAGWLTCPKTGMPPYPGGRIQV